MRYTNPLTHSDWRHLANTVERSMRGGDAALCQITLTSLTLLFGRQLSGNQQAVTESCLCCARYWEISQNNH